MEHYGGGVIGTKEWHLHTDDLRNAAPNLRAGDRVFLSGTVYTARDAAHKRLFAERAAGKEAPFPLTDAVIYYSGSTPAPEGRPIGSCGPTTSGRMDVYTPQLYEDGVVATVGKGKRAHAVVDAIKRCGAVYFCAVGGAGALAAQRVTACEVIAYDDLGCEAVKRVTWQDFPLIVAVDANGNDLFAS